MKKKILGEIISIALYIAAMVICIVALPHVEDFASRFDYEDTVWVFACVCLAIIFIFWCPLMIMQAINEIHNHILFDKYKKKE